MAGVYQVKPIAGNPTLMMHSSYLCKEGSEASLEG